MPTPDNTVMLVVNGLEVTGWESVSINRRCEGIPNDFELTLGPLDSTTGGSILAQAGDDVQLYIGRDLVLTGYVVDGGAEGDADTHTLTLVGAGRTCDLVDCSAEAPGGGLLACANLLDLATKLAKPYGSPPGSLTVSAAAGANVGQVIPEIALNYGETPAAIIERVARNARVLFYEDVRGNLFLSQVGATQAANGFVYGQNIKRWSNHYSWSGRFSEVYCAMMSTDPVYDQGAGSFALFGGATDTAITRHRRLVIVTDGLSKQVALDKAQWQVNRAAGRGQPVTLTVQGWRDAAGTLWTPNTLAPVTLPGLPQTMMCISSVAYRETDDGGTVAELVLMPPGAFALEPIMLQPPEPDVAGPNSSGTPSF